MRRIAAHGDAAANARRLEIADQATIGMREATQRGERLRELAERAGDDLVASALSTMLRHGYTTCVALAETERTIAGAYESLIERANAPAAAAYRRAADSAHASAAALIRRAEEPHQMQREAAPAPP